MCAPDPRNPSWHVYMHMSPVAPLQTVSEFAIVKPPVQATGVHDPPLKFRSLPQTWEPVGV